MICPFCYEENIDGADACEHCQEPLDFLTRPQPVSNVERHLLRDDVLSLLPRNPVVVEPSEPVGKVLQVLVNRSIGCVVVVDGQDVVGIFSERDALQRLNVEATEFADRPISEFMTPSPETIEADAEIVFALHKMDVGGYRHLPVLRKGHIVGVISIRDILQYITSHLATVE